MEQLTIQSKTQYNNNNQTFYCIGEDIRRCIYNKEHKQQAKILTATLILPRLHKAVFGLRYCSSTAVNKEKKTRTIQEYRMYIKVLFFFLSSSWWLLIWDTRYATANRLRSRLNTKRAKKCRKLPRNLIACRFNGLNNSWIRLLLCAAHGSSKLYDLILKCVFIVVYPALQLTAAYQWWKPFYTDFFNIPSLRRVSWRWPYLRLVRYRDLIVCTRSCTATISREV